MDAATVKKEHPKVIVVKVVHAEIERVFDAWTNPRLIEQWFFPPSGSARTTNDLRVGGKYHHEMILKQANADCGPGESRDDGTHCYPHDGEYLEISRPNRLVFTWSSIAVKNTRVTVDLRTVPEGTEIRITHELIDSEDQRNSHNDGWTECLASLGEYLMR